MHCYLATGKLFQDTSKYWKSGPTWKRRLITILASTKQHYQIWKNAAIVLAPWFAFDMTKTLLWWIKSHSLKILNLFQSISTGKLPPVRNQIWYKCTRSGRFNPIMHRTDPNYFKFLTDKLKWNFTFCLKFWSEYYFRLLRLYYRI